MRAVSDIVWLQDSERKPKHRRRNTSYFTGGKKYFPFLCSAFNVSDMAQISRRERILPRADEASAGGKSRVALVMNRELCLVHKRLELSNNF